VTIMHRIGSISLRGCRRYVSGSFINFMRNDANMVQMQAAGSPPPDLVGDMNAAQEALSEMDQGCPTQ
jgi:hypothetical protein